MCKTVWCPVAYLSENIFWRDTLLEMKYILLKSALKMQEMPFQRPKFQNGISNLYILLKSAPKMQEMPFQRPKFQKIYGGHAPDPPRIVSSLWPPPH